MKTVHITNAWHSTSGGIGTFYRALLQGAERRQHTIRLIVPGERDAVEDVSRFARIYQLRAPRAPFNPQYRLMYPSMFLLPNSPIPKILKHERPDLVEINDKYTLAYLGGLLRERMLSAIDYRPTIVGLSCERMDENMAAYLSRSQMALRFVREYMKWIYFPLFDHHIAVSQYTAAELIVAARGHKVQRGVWMGAMGVDFACFSQAVPTQQSRTQLLGIANASPDAKLLLYCGRLAREKNLSLLADTLTQLPSTYHLLIVGSGEMREWLAAKLNAQAPGRSAFLGHVADRQQLADIYANVDAFLHPNPSEPFGIAPLEAMAAGLPLIAPNSGGLTTYANASNAWLTEPTGEAFAQAVVEALADSKSRTHAARRTAESYGWEAATSYFFDLYEELHAISQGRPSPYGLSPTAYSTPGDYFGREIHTAQPSRMPPGCTSE